MNANTTLNVLIVDDDELVRTALLQALISAGHNVRSVDGGLAALSEIDGQIPDLLLSDLNMPGLSGFELLATVRRRYPGIYVIAMSGSHFPDGVPTGVLADEFHEKKHGAGPLVQRVADLVRQGQSYNTRVRRRPANPRRPDSAAL